MNKINESAKIRNYNADDSQNRNWYKLLLRLRDGKQDGEKYGRFVTMDDRVVFIGGPGSGAGGTSAGSASGTLTRATYQEGGSKGIASLDTAEQFIENGLSIPSAGIEHVNSGTRGEIKDEIVTKLSADSGVDYDTVNIIIKTWAGSSNDNNPNALAIQQEAAKMFGASLSEWQQGKVDHYEKGNERIILKDGKLVNIKPALEPNKFTRPQIRSVLNAMYEHTQTQLAAAGIPEYITLRRGVADINLPKGSIQNIYSNTLSSFTSYSGVAKYFRGSGIIMEIQIPRSRILATARTGFGCLDEAEYVVIGNNTGSGDQVKVIE